MYNLSLVCLYLYRRVFKSIIKYGVHVLISLPWFQDYLRTHMYGNAGRDDLWNKFSEVSLHICDELRRRLSLLVSVSILMWF